MPISYVAGNTVSNSAGSTAGNQSCSVPTGTIDGDVMFAVVYKGADSVHTLTAPAGWNQVNTAVDTTNINGSFWYKIANSEPASYTWQVSSTGVWGVGQFTFRGVDTDSTIHQSNNASYTTTDPITAPSVTTSISTVILTFIASRQASTTEITFTSADAGTEIADWGFDGGASTRNGALYYSAEVTPGTYAYTVNPTGSVTNSVGFTVAVIPQALTGTVTVASPLAVPSFTTSVTASGTLADTAGSVTTTSAGTVNVQGTLDAVAPAASVDMTGTGPLDYLSTAAPAATSTADGTLSITGTVSVTAKKPTINLQTETRVVGDSVEIVEAEDRTLYIPQDPKIRIPDPRILE